MRGNVLAFYGKPLEIQIEPKGLSHLKKDPFIRRKKFAIIIDLMFLHQVNDTSYPRTNQGIDLLFGFFQIRIPGISPYQKFTWDNPV